jgi:hypothetical protein
MEGKSKSSEIIEDSDEEEEDDEFAAILRAEMARVDDDHEVLTIPAVTPEPLPGNVRVAAEYMYYDDSTESEESDDDDY